MDGAELPERHAGPFWIEWLELETSVTAVLPQRASRHVSSPSLFFSLGFTLNVVCEVTPQACCSS